jgi:predicted alpha/beta hydrolase
VKIVVASPDIAPKGTFLLFPGGNGRLVVKDNSVIRVGFGRSSLSFFAKHGFAAVAVDVPSDQANGYSEQFRISDAHLEDVKTIIKFATRKWEKPVFLLGHSSGTLSAAHLAATLGDGEVRALVVASSPTTRGRRGGGMLNLPDIPLRKIVMPALVVHHRDDACRTTSFSEATRLPSLFTTSPRVALLEVRGGETLAWDDPCGGSWNAHNFFGKESEVVAAIVGWALGGHIPKRIGP